MGGRGAFVPPLREAMRAFPIAGALLGVLAGLVFAVAGALGLPVAIAAILCICALVLATGALHEDGLADVADGFGASRDRERMLKIMRDSHIGTFGTLALIAGFALRVAAVTVIASLASGVSMVPVLAAAGAMSRGAMPALLNQLPPARDDGRSAEAGRPSRETVVQSLLAGGAIWVVCVWYVIGFWTAVFGLAAAAAVYFLVKRIARQRLGGQTGDVCGALQQTTEVVLLLVLAAAV